VMCRGVVVEERYGCKDSPLEVKAIHLIMQHWATGKL
jgi:hypothetical protein